MKPRKRLNHDSRGLKDDHDSQNKKNQANHENPKNQGSDNVPRLRFPEFRESGDWEVKKLSQICDINPSVNNLPETFVYIDLESVEAGCLLKKNMISREGSPSRAQRLLARGDIIFQMVRPYQKNNYFFLPDDGLDYVASTGYAQLRARESNGYLFQYLHNDRFVDRVLAKCTGSNYPAINSNELAEIPVEGPTPPEQQRIADCLTSLDELIASESKKLDALKTHKKGLMQKLFPNSLNHDSRGLKDDHDSQNKKNQANHENHENQGSDNFPELRFPEFRGKGEWEVKKLGNPKISKFISDRVSLRQLHLDTYVSTENLLPDYAGLKKAVRLPPSGSFTHFQKGDVLISNIRPYLKKVWSADREGTSSNDIIIIRSGEKVISNFLTCILKNDQFIDYVMLGAKGVKMPRGDISSMKEYLVAFPSHPEQQRIADCLTSLDELMAAQAQKIDALKLHKKGLMQGLFPADTEVGA